LIKLHRRPPYRIEIFFDKQRFIDAGRKLVDILLLLGQALAEEKKRKLRKRKNFSKLTKKLTLLKQGFLCNWCKQPSKHWDFHHIDGNRSNNRPSNCEALCPVCHTEKTRKRRF